LNLEALHSIDLVFDLLLTEHHIISIPHLFVQIALYPLPNASFLVLDVVSQRLALLVREAALADRLVGPRVFYVELALAGRFVDARDLN
jgi:hypothetical protein